MLYRIECFVRAMQDSTCLEDSANGWESCQVIDEAATKSPGLSCLFTLVLGPMDCHGRRMRVPVRSHSGGDCRRGRPTTTRHGVGPATARESRPHQQPSLPRGHRRLLK